MGEQKILHVDIISPEKPLYSGAALSLRARAWDGMLGIFPGHAPMVTKLGIGEVHILREGEDGKVTDKFAIRHGYLEVAHNKVVVLTEDAVAIDEMKGVKPEDIESLRSRIAETKDRDKRADLESELAWLLACDKLLKDVE